MLLFDVDLFSPCFDMESLSYQGRFTVIRVGFIVAHVGSNTFSGFKSLICDMFTHHEFHAENQASGQQISLCVIRAQETHANGM